MADIRDALIAGDKGTGEEGGFVKKTKKKKKKTTTIEGNN